MKLKVSVTQEDIFNGVPVMGRFCPIARALTRILGKVSVGNVRVALDGGDRILFGVLPKIAQRFILDFDAGNPVHPFEFELELL
jgi:hypothetical protein